MNLSAMAPNHHHFMLNGPPMEPVSRTYQYRKIMKPMLERKRRARINKCLDELKDLMTGTLQADGENVSKLEKADILELTVRHLHRLREHNSLFLQANMLGGNGSNSGVLNTEKFWAGFQHCAAEVLQFLGRYDRAISGELIQHIAGYLPGLPLAATPPAPPNLPPPPPPPPPPPTATAALPTTAAAAGAPPTTRRPHLLARPESARATARARPRPYPRPREDEEPVWRPW